MLVHGLTGSTAWWKTTIAALQPRHDVRVITLPGFTARRRGRPRFALPEAAAWLAHELGDSPEPVVLVGHSLGGMISVLAAARAPERVARLVVIAPAGVFASSSRSSYVVPVLRVLSRKSPRTLPLLVRDVLRAGPLRLLHVAADLLASDLRPALREVQAPTLVVWGSEDPLLPPTVGEVFAGELPDARLLVLPRSGHVPMVDASDELNAALVAFLEERADERG